MAWRCYYLDMKAMAGFWLNIDPQDRNKGFSLEVESHDGHVEVRVPAGMMFTKPVIVRWEWPECGAETKAIFHVEKNARVVFIEELKSVASGKWKVKSSDAWSHDCHVIGGEGASIEFISINRVGSGIAVEMKQHSQLSDNAEIRWKNVTLAAASVTHELTSELTGSDALSSIDWMFYAKNDEKYQLNARNIFTGRHGGGEITMKGVAEDQGHVRCNGKIEIGVGGGETDTYLTQDVLMLDKTAKVDAVPGLEIKTNDVKASHSATVSRVTDEDLFYFAARGIIEREARRMFVEGFLGEMVAKISSESSREEILAAVGGKYGI